MELKRLLLFLIGCIGTRSLLVYLAANASNEFLSLMGWIALIPAIGFLLIYFFHLRETGPEVFGEKIWWNDLRPVHAALYGLFAAAAITKQSYAWTFLLADVIVGLVSFLVHHFGN